MSEQADFGNGRQVLDSLDPSCNELKHAYDACFNEWFTGKFLAGKHKGETTPCDELLKIYSECVKTALKNKKINLEDLSSDGGSSGSKKKT